MRAVPAIEGRQWSLWCTSHLEIHLDERRVRVAGGQTAPDAAPGPDALWVLTAWNPFGVARRRAANLDAGRHLLAALAAAGIPWWFAVGAAPDGSWEEEGVAVRLPGRAAALELGRRWEQLAVYEWSPAAGVLSVVACFESRATTLWAQVIDLAPPAG